MWKIFLIQITHAKRVFKDFEIINLAKYPGFYVQSITLLWADVFENFQNMCSKIYELDPTRSLAAPRLAWAEALKMAKVKLSDIDMLLMVQKSITGRALQPIYWYAKNDNKNMKRYDKIKEWSYLKYWDVNNLHHWAIMEKFPEIALSVPKILLNSMKIS